MKVLVTGGAGFIGSHLTEELLKYDDNEVTVMDNLSTGAHIPERAKFVQADVNELGGFEEEFDYIYHYAAMVGVQRTLNDPIGVLRDIEGTRHVLDLAVETGVKRVFFASSSEVYGEPVELPQHEETTPLNSRLTYAVVKNVGEATFRAYEQIHDQPYTIFRFFNTYGPRQRPDFVMSKFVERALANEPIPVYGDGSQTRTFCYVDDNIETTIKAIDDESTVNSVINVGNNQEITMNDLAGRIIDLTGSKSKIVTMPPLKEGDMTRRLPDITKMVKLLGRWPIDIDEGITRLLKSY